MEIKTTEEIRDIYGQTGLQETKEDKIIIRKKWVAVDDLKKLLCEIEDPIKFRKALLNALSNETTFEEHKKNCDCCNSTNNENKNKEEEDVRET